MPDCHYDQGGGYQKKTDLYRALRMIAAPTYEKTFGIFSTKLLLIDLIEK